jgi:hypothetical protein
MTNNLLVALNELSQPRWNVTGSASWFRIDALCINQRNNEEKSRQVKIIGQIFSNANRVLVWLGDAENNSDLAMECLPSVVASMPATAAIPDLFGETANRLPVEDDPVWQALYALFNRPYFRRGWVIQEIVLAKEIDVLCGNKVISWNILTEFAGDVSNSLPDTLLVKDPSFHGRNSRTGRVSCSLLQQLKDNVVEGQLSSAGSAALVCIATEKEFTDPRDRLFALIGVLPPNISDSIHVDYSGHGKSLIGMGKTMLPWIPNLFTLSVKQPFSHAETIPPWCPDFHSQSHLLA